MIRVKDAAKRIGLSVSSLNKMRCYGTGPVFYKLGSAIFYRADDLDAWLAERRRTSTWCANDNSSSRPAVAA